MRNPVHDAILSAAVAALAGCAVGPDYVRPETAAAEAFRQLDTALYGAEEPVAEFWRGFEDPLLGRLVEGALAANTDLRAALARLEAARALARESKYDFAPTVTASASSAETRGAALDLPGVAREDRDGKRREAGADVFWELDLFGRVRRGAQASAAEREAAAADLRALQVSVAAETARTYFELRGLQEQLRVARRNAENQRNTLVLTEIRLTAGRGTDFDVARARAQLESTRATVPVLEAAVAAAVHRLAVLNGREPNAFAVELEPVVALPALPAAVAVGTPAELLRRRPDIQAAERRLAAATARIGVATGELFPKLTFNGTIGSAAANMGDLFARDAEQYAFGPALSWSFLDLGRVRARIKASEAGAAASLALYEGTVLRALEEAENALVGYGRTRRERDHLGDAVAASREAARLARLRFEGGAADFLQVLDAERSLLDAENRLAASHTRTATALVAVYRSVAGGWPTRAPGEPAATVASSQ